MSAHKKLRGSVIRVEQEAADLYTAVVAMVATIAGGVFIGALLKLTERLC